jgi:hypothetical protein
MNTIFNCIACGVSAVIAGAAGWTLRGADTAARDEAQRVIDTPQSQQPVEVHRDTAPVIAVLHDGNVTLHVEQRPLDWVLQQITLQRGLLDAKHSAHANAPAGAVAAQSTCTDAPADAARILQTIAQGGDVERFDGLMQARHVSAFVPDDILKTLYENDPSDRVRLAAFEIYLERHSGESATVRKALEAALQVSSAAIQQDARQRLEEVIERDRIDAASSQGTQP